LGGAFRKTRTDSAGGTPEWKGLGNSNAGHQKTKTYFRQGTWLKKWNKKALAEKRKKQKQNDWGDFTGDRLTDD